MATVWPGSMRRLIPWMRSVPGTYEKWTSRNSTSPLTFKGARRFDDSSGSSSRSKNSNSLSADATMLCMPEMVLLRRSKGCENSLT